MRFTALIALALGSVASAAVLISTGDGPISFTVKDRAQLSSINSRVSAALASVQATRLADPTAASYISAISQYVATRTDAPASLIFASDVTSIATTVPPWVTAMPSELANWRDKINKEDLEVAKSVLVDAGVLKGMAAAQPTGRIGMLGAGVAAAIGAVALL